MDGRVVAALLTLGLPALLIGVTIWQFSSNPLAVLGLLTVMIAGILYLLTFKDSL